MMLAGTYTYISKDLNINIDSSWTWYSQNWKQHTVQHQIKGQKDRYIHEAVHHQQQEVMIH